MGQSHGTNSPIRNSSPIDPLMKTHGQRRRRVVGCMNCYQEILPDVKLGASRDCLPSDTDSGSSTNSTIDGNSPRVGWGYVCGSCREAYWICEECIESIPSMDGVIEHSPGHPLFREPVELEVDVSGIEAMVLDESGTYRACDSLKQCFEAYKRRWLVGERVGFDVDDGDTETGEYIWRSYASVFEEATSAFIAIQELLNLPSDSTVPFCLLVGAASPVWYCAYFSMLLYGIPLAPVLPTSTPAQLYHVQQTTNSRLVIASKHLPLPDEFFLDESLRIIYLDDSPSRYVHYNYTQNSVLQNQNDVGIEWKSLVERGRELRSSSSSSSLEVMSSWRPRDDNVQLLLSSSGTTGVPKLVMVSDSMLRQACGPPSFGVPTVLLCIRPLRHAVDLVAKGGRIGCFTSLTHLRSDLSLVRPTLFGSSPSFFLSLSQEFNSELLMTNIETEETDRRRELEEEWVSRNVLGNRCRFVLIGGAVSSAELKSFIFDALGAACCDGYGTSETGAVSFDGSVREGVVLQLVDAPKLGYLTSDEPFPRGEIVVFKERMSPGYFGDEEATRKRFVSIGGVKYSRTGDIGRIVVVDGKRHVEIIDRASALFKLRNGVFVAPSPIECLLENSPLVERVFVWGMSSMARVGAAVVVVAQIEEDEDDGEDSLRNAIRMDFVRIAQENGLEASHVPGVIVLDKEAWTSENGLLNAAGKPIRSALALRYRDLILSEASRGGEVIEEEEQEEEGEEGVGIVSDQQSQSGLLAGLEKLIVESIPGFDPSHLPEGRLSAEMSLFSLGADSLSYARIVGAARQRFGSSLTLPTLMKCESLADVQVAVFGGGVTKPKASSQDFWRGEIDEALGVLRALCSEPQLDETESTETHPVTHNRTVLLSGARGFVGSFLLAELCRRDARVVCVLRGEHDLDSTVSSSLEFYSLPTFSGLWTTVAGDISQSGFGCFEDLSAFQGASRRIGGSDRPDVILHCAAAVGTSAPYSFMKPHNVFGSVHAAALAHSFGCHLLHVSTVGFLPVGMLESTPTIEDLYPEGDLPPVLGPYCQTKWVAERVLLEFMREVERRTFSLSMVRVGTCFASETGASNPRDAVIRLISGLAREGLYTDCGPSMPLPSSFALTPVDWVAQTIVSDHLSRLFETGTIEAPLITLAATIDHTPLEHIIDAIIECGITMEKVDVEEFRRRLGAIQDETHPLFVFASSLAAETSPSSTPTTSGNRKKKRRRRRTTSDVPKPNLQAAIGWMIERGFIVL